MLGAYFGDSTQLTYLRSRFYASGAGRFLTRDTWMGDYNRPLSLNRWMYVEGNPVNRTDPSGRCWYPNLQTGGTSVDISDLSSGICPWFVDAFQQNGVTIPVDATPDNWVNNLPPHLRSLILTHAGCVGDQNQTFLTPSRDYWMVIRYSTSPKWKYYETTSTGVEYSLVLGFGGGGSLSCDNNTKECTASGHIDIGQGISVGTFELDVSFGVGVEKSLHNGSFALGGRASAGPCDLFVSITKISVGCTAMSQTIESGWQRDRIEQQWVLVNWLRVGTIGFEEFGKRLPFTKPNSKIYYQVEKTGNNKLGLWMEYFDRGLIVFP